MASWQLSEPAQNKVLADAPSSSAPHAVWNAVTSALLLPSAFANPKIRESPRRLTKFIFFGAVGLLRRSAGTIIPDDE
jgi:hypothetical protein